MTKIIIDDETREKLNGLKDRLELCDEDGVTLGFFHPKLLGGESADLQIDPPFSEEELARRRRESTGRSLAEIMEDLRKS